jgi:hypothetical protein
MKRKIIFIENRSAHGKKNLAYLTRKEHDTPNERTLRGGFDDPWE